MIIPDEKLKVFISSACGDEPKKHKYNLVRTSLKTLIDATQLAKAYTFESAGASIASAGQHYRSHLRDSDVCIFLIDNQDGVPPGVQEEIDIVNKHGIFAFYYFCDEHTKEKTPLQRSLSQQGYPKNKTVHSFEGFIEQVGQDLIEDLVFIYKRFCKNEVVYKPGLDDFGGNLYATYSTNWDRIIPKSITRALDHTKNYFSLLILEQAIEIKESSNMDRLCAEFLPIIFEAQTLDANLLIQLANEIKEHQSENHFLVTQQRLNAIREYFVGNQQACLEKLNGALRLAKEKSLPAWIVSDILVDLRNQASIFYEGQNSYLLNNKYQEELDRSDFVLHFPLLDRFSSVFYKELAKEQFEYRIKSPYSVTLGHSLHAFIDSLANSFVLAMFNGSLTHLHMLYSKIVFLTFYLSKRYSNWCFKKLLLKMAVVTRTSKEVDGILRCFTEILGKMDAADALEIYRFADNMTVPHQKSRAKLEAFRIIGYFLDDEQFQMAWIEISELLNMWLAEADESAPINLGSNIFAALERTHLRIGQDQVVGFLCKCLELNKRRFYSDVFRFISRNIRLKQLSTKSSEKLLNYIIREIESEKTSHDTSHLQSAIVALRMQDRELTEGLDSVVAKHMPNFYDGEYRLETTEDDACYMPVFIRQYVAEIEERNRTQGQGGRYTGYAHSPHLTIDRIIRFAENREVFDQNLIDLVFEACCDTLVRETQTIETKMDAINLMVSLSKFYPMTIDNNSRLISDILTNRKTVESGKASMMTNLNDNHLRLNALLLYYVLGEDVNIQLMEMLAAIGDDTLSQVTAAQNFRQLIEADDEPLDASLEFLILQSAMTWCNSSSIDVRHEAVKILFLLLRRSENDNIICNQFVRLMDVDNVYIKNLILRNAAVIKRADRQTYDYIVQKASLDTNFAVRSVFDELCGEEIA